MGFSHVIFLVVKSAIQFFIYKIKIELNEYRVMSLSSNYFL